MIKTHTRHSLVFKETIQNKIYFIRGKKIMLDADLAALYQTSTFRLNEAVKRNIKRFPEDFMFRLTHVEHSNLISQFAISSWGGLIMRLITKFQYPNYKQFLNHNVQNI